VDRYEFILAMTSIVMGSGTIAVLFHSIAKIVSRRNAPAVSDGAVGRLDDRLARMEQAIDTMAVEMERISEGQRFTTKLLSEREPTREPARDPARDRLKA
jgi:hypothetical protein